MNTATFPSIFTMTLLLVVGLIFFIRASVKDRTQQVKLLAKEPEESLLTRVQHYFSQRAYRLVSVDETTHQVIFEGFVQPSWFLAIFLSVLAACGLLCVSLVFSTLYPKFTPVFLGFVILAPLAGIYYWTKAGRTEQVSLKVNTVSNQQIGTGSLITVTAHRDELQQFQQALKLDVAPETTASS